MRNTAPNGPNVFTLAVIPKSFDARFFLPRGKEVVSESKKHQS